MRQDGDASSAINQLRELGFTDYEARTYLALLERSPATAYEVSKTSGLPRANVYTALESLTKKMAVQPVSENPSRFAPIKPKILFERIATDVSRKCQGVAKLLATRPVSDSTEYVWSLSGEESIRKKIDETICSAKHHVWIKASTYQLDAHLSALKRATKRGVDILLILFGDDPSTSRFRFARNVKVYRHEGSGMEVGLSSTLITLTTDFEDAIIVNTAYGGSGAHTRSRPVVDLADSLIRHEVYLAEIFEHLGGAIEERLGPSLLSLRSKYLPPEQVKRLEDNLTAKPGARPTNSRRTRATSKV
jgi:sugar-specific transcriptional regulator TrmB